MHTTAFKVGFMYMRLRVRRSFESVSAIPSKDQAPCLKSIRTLSFDSDQYGQVHTA